jgi:hypothetical protein
MPDQGQKQRKRETVVNENAPPIIADPAPKRIEVEVLPPEPEPPAGMRNPQAAPQPSRKSAYKAAMFLAVLVDAIQIGLFPIFGPGFLSVADVILDVLAFALFWRLVGWHPALLPGLIFEQLPLLDLAPTWTIAVWIAIRRNSRAQTLEPGEVKAL